MTKKQYLQPEVLVAQMASAMLMNTTSPTTVDVHTDIPGEQW